MKIKKLATEHKPGLGRQLLWFAGMYLVSILALWAFHGLCQLLIKLLA